jgi:tetratricopeptide (TPR) repeat protein
MKHSNWYILIAACVFTTALNAQVKHSKAFKKTLREADLAFEMDDFKNAESRYMSIWKQDSLNDNINLNLAVCKFRLKELPDSVLYFLRRADRSTKPEVQFYEGKLYHLTHRFNEAIEHYQQYKKTPQGKREVNDMEVDRLITISQRAADMMAHPHKASIKNIGSSINTKYDEYVPLISTDERIMYFTSRRPGGVGNKTDAWGKYYEDIYMTEVVDGFWKEPVNIGPPVNSETHDACVAVSADLQQMIVYRTTADGLSGDLYHTEQTEKGWGPLAKYGVEINSDAKEFSATFNLENNVIYFSSDRAGGFGGKDIYRTVRLPNGNWSLPWNLGPNVNTPYDEDAPFLHIDGTTLYFSSKGHETMGEYDVFKTTISEDNQFSKAENLGFPINTVGEDIFFVLSADGRHGYYSSLNENPTEIGYESEDIYFIDMRYSEEDIKVRKGLCLDAEGKPLTAKITLINSETNKVEGVYTSAAGTGKFVFAINPYYSYKMITDLKGYETNITEIHPLVEDNDSAEDHAELKINLKKK